MHAVNDGWADFDAGARPRFTDPRGPFVEFPGKHFFFNNDTIADAVANQIEEFVTGARRVPSNDRALATVLFTDIVGSTERLVWLVIAPGATWLPLITTSSGLSSMFTADVRSTLPVTASSRPSTGLGALSPARRSVIDRLWPVGLDIRAGVHTGECELVNDKVGGIAVHVGARIAALAGPREVLVSSTVKDLTAGSGITLTITASAHLGVSLNNGTCTAWSAVGDRNQ